MAQPGDATHAPSTSAGARSVAWLRAHLMWLVLLVPVLTYLHEARRFGRWIVDDAGITFAYARSVADGLGVIQQPGVPPVEGFSNPLWMFALAIGKLLGMFDSGRTLGSVPDYVWYPKLLGFACFVAGLGVMQRGARPVFGANKALIIAALAGTLLALDPSYVGWANSGLENPLHGLIVVAMAATLAAATYEGRLGVGRFPLHMAVLALFAALSRPDGLIYAGAYPLVLLFASQEAFLLRIRRALSGYVLPLAALLLLALLLRYAIFHAWIPNTALAKAQKLPTLADLEGIADLVVYPGLVFSFCAVAIVSIAVAATTCQAQDRSRRHALGSAIVPLFLAVAAFGVLKKDWMGNLRFATPVWTSGAFVFAWALFYILESDRFGVRTRVATGLIALVGLSASLHVMSGKMTAFSARPTLPMCYVADQYRIFNIYGDRLGIRKGTFALPDLGGSLLTSRYVLFDTAGLTDPNVARLLAQGDNAGATNYLLTVVKPTFFHRHGGWSAALERNPRFKADYLDLYMNHDFVRRDAVVGKEAAIATLRKDALRLRPGAQQYYRDHPRYSCGDRLIPGSLPDPRVLVDAKARPPSLVRPRQ
jgi:hypothetical protein